MTTLLSTLVEFEGVQPDGSTHRVQVNPIFIASICAHGRVPEFRAVSPNSGADVLVPTTLIQMAGGYSEHIVKGTVDQVAEKLREK